MLNQDIAIFKNHYIYKQLTCVTMYSIVIHFSVAIDSLCSVWRDLTNVLKCGFLSEYIKGWNKSRETIEVLLWDFLPFTFSLSLLFFYFIKRLSKWKEHRSKKMKKNIVKVVWSCIFSGRALSFMTFLCVSCYWHRTKKGIRILTKQLLTNLHLWRAIRYFTELEG